MLFKTTIVIVLVVICESSFISDVPNLDGKLNMLTIPEERYVAIINEPFDIHLSNIHIAYGWCNSVNFDKQIGNVPTVNASGIHFSNITDEISTLWKCVLVLDLGWDANSTELKLNTTHCTFHFHLHVKGSKKVKVTVNNKELSFVRVNLSLPYDGEAVYSFEEDENVDVVCKNIYSTGSVHIKYITKEFSYVDPKNVTEVSKFCAKLTSEYVHSSFECIYTSKYNETYVYRINFLPKSTDNRSIANSKEKVINNLDTNAAFFMVGCFVGATIIVLVIIGIGCYFKRRGLHKNQKEDLYAIYDSAAPDLTNTYANVIETPQYANQGYYETPYSGDRESTNVYAEINYAMCNQNTIGLHARESVVYDAPYGRISVIRANHRQT